MATTDVAALTGTIETILNEHIEGVVRTEDGGFTVRNGTAQIFVEAAEWGDGGSTLVVINVPLLWDAKPTPALFEWIATHANDYVFGHLWVQYNEEDQNQVGIVMSHNLLADNLGTDELMHAVVGIGSIADDLDDQLQAQFGGRRFHEPEAN